MKSLETVQKTFKVFEVITKIMLILCIIAASLYALGALCAIVWKNGGHVFSILGKPIESFIDGDYQTAYAKLSALTLTTVANGVLFGFANDYFKHEQVEGTPFTKKGVHRLKMLGIRCIYIPIIALTLSAIIAKLQGVNDLEITSNYSSLALGIGLILVSIVFQYGTELRKSNLDNQIEDNE